MKPFKQKKTAGYSYNQLPVFALPTSPSQRFRIFLLSFGITLP